MKRHEISDEQWAALEPLLPKNTHRRGRPWKDHRMIINGILWILNTGAAWRDLPERFGPWQTVYDRYNCWRTDGTWRHIARQLLKRLDRQRQIGWDLVAIDATQIRATRAASGARKKGDLTTSARPTRQRMNPRTMRSGARGEA